jgi:hypothetical protein
MAKSVKKTPPKKRVGRPFTGDAAQTRTVRLTDKFMAEVERWAAEQPDKPRRSVALRQLLELGLKRKISK